MLNTKNRFIRRLLDSHTGGRRLPEAKASGAGPNAVVMPSRAFRKTAKLSGNQAFERVSWGGTYSFPLQREQRNQEREARVPMVCNPRTFFVRVNFLGFAQKADGLV